MSNGNKEVKNKVQTEKTVCVDNLRYAEYYSMQETFDELYARSKSGEKFPDLMGIILSRENILLAYRSIKGNTGSVTPGTDGLTIKDIGRISPEELVGKVRKIVKGGPGGYTPKPVRRKDIPKTNGSVRPLGIPCIWDRLVQQCIKQVMEPICEAKFSDNSYGFRPQRNVEHAIAATYKLIQRSHLHYIIEFDIKGFFDNVDHTKLMRQIWALGIHDKHLIWVIKRILKAPIRMPDGNIVYPKSGTPQGGIISPLLANIVLNELDRWIESQWQKHPITKKYAHAVRKSGCEDLSSGYKAMRNTGLKEMYIVRYADDFRIFCRNRNDAKKTCVAVTRWLAERLKLEVSKEKTRIVNVKCCYSEFLGFRIKAHNKADKYVVKSHMAEKRLKQEKEKLVLQAQNVAKPRTGKTERDEIMLYNAMVTGIQNYYQIATEISSDCRKLNRAVMTVFTNRLKMQRRARLVRKGRMLTEAERKRYGKSDMLRYVASSNEPLYPIGYVRHCYPKLKRRSICSFTPDGRNGLHDNLRINKALMLALMRQPQFDRSAEYADNRISLFSAQWGRCAVTNHEFTSLEEIHCHHKNPREKGGGDEYANLELVWAVVHKLVHATKEDTIRIYLDQLNLNKDQLIKLNTRRKWAGLPAIWTKD